MPSLTEPLIKVSDVWRLFGPQRQDRALAGVNLRVTTGDFLCLAGPSGSGKTTLLNLIGLLDLPSSGQIEILGQDTGNLNLKQRALLRRHRLGFIFQAYNLIPVLTAFENVEYPLILSGKGQQERHDLTRQALNAVGIAEHASKRPSELSGGQQQRVAVARAIAGSPPIILADEPTGNLDSKTGAALIELLLHLNQQRGITFLFSSHDPNVIKQARRIVILKDGQIDREWQEGKDTNSQGIFIGEHLTGEPPLQGKDSEEWCKSSALRRK
ncbi:MAG: ABC transporter ATP-binding protein [Desulfobulbaceae bacterium]|nr:ABC transporter ATP-binding protein [Desulfobulbaceae bacterium]